VGCGRLGQTSRKVVSIHVLFLLLSCFMQASAVLEVGIGNRKEDIPIAYNAHIDLLVCHGEYGQGGNVCEKE
jgi:hypothetical protein